MNPIHTSVRHRKRSEEDAESGFTLLGVLILLAIFTLSLSVAVPQITREIQRDRERECLHRGQQYARAIRLFYRRNGHYPTDVGQLENTNEIRYLRRRYTDPITNSDWKIVYEGEVKPDLLDHGREFFGVQVPSTSTVIPNGMTAGIPPPSFSASGNNGGVTHFLGSTGSLPGEGPGDGSVQQAAGAPENGSSGSTASGTKPMGNRRIVGVCSFSTRRSMLIYKKQKRYVDWQFIYDPASDGLVSAPNLGVPGPSLSNPPAPMTTTP